MKHPTKRFLRPVWGVLAATALTGAAHASTNVFDFNSDPSGFLNITRGGDNGELSGMAGFWFASGGSTLEAGITDPSTNGYLAITQTTSDPIFTAHGMSSTVIFDDFDGGLVVAGFTFSCDVRVGGGSATPADGFSLNFARADDPVLSGGAFGSGPGGTPANAREEGTQTGLAVCFDAFSNSGTDPIGLTIKVDGNVLTNLAMGTLNGSCTDITSLQTGPNTAGITNLCWQPLLVNLGTDGRLTVRYKNVTLLTNYLTTFVPSAGRLIFAGRTGGSWQEQDVDNIRIVTIAPGTPVVGQPTANASGFRFNIIDSGFATPDTNTITLTLDGTPVAASAIVQTGNPGGGTGITTVGYRDTGILLQPGSTHTNVIHFSGSTFNGDVTVTNVFTVPAYTFLTSAQKAPGAVNTSLSGFAGRIHQLPVPRFPSVTNLIGVERQLANGFIDPETSQPYVSTALVSTFNNEVINWNKDQPNGIEAGFFTSAALPPQDWADEPVPGVDPFSLANTDNVAAELLTILDLPVGAYSLGVNRDDGFKLSIGAEPRDAFAATVLASSAGAGDSSVDFAVTNAGRYPFRLVWSQNLGVAQLEFYLTDLTTGQKVLINNRTNPTHIVAYRDTAALTQPYVRWTYPAPNETGIAPSQAVIAKLKDGSAGSIVGGSVSLKVNGGGTAQVTKSGDETTVTTTGWPLPAGSLGTATLVYSTTVGGPYTNTWSFYVSYYGQVLFNFPLNEGSGNTVTDTVQGLVGTFTVSTALWTNGSTGNPNDTALFFDATRRLTVSDTNRLINLGADLSGTNSDYTMECWVRLPLGYEPTARVILFSYEGLPGFSFSINGPGRTLHTTTFTFNDVNSGAVVPNDNQWHHVAVIHQNGVRMLYYIDGALISAVPYTRGVGVRSTYALTFGTANGGANPLIGSLDRVRLTKGVLKPPQFDLNGPPPAPDTTPGDTTTALALHLKLDEMDSLTAADSSGNGRNATMNNFPDATTHWMPGRYAGAAAFNPSLSEQQYASVPDTDGTLNLTNAIFSIATWVKASPFGQSTGGGIITKGAGGGGEQFNLDINGSGVLRFFVRNASGTVTTLATIGNNTNTINGNWLHAVAVCDGANPTNGLRLYLNGVLSLVGTAPTSLLNSAHEISVGAREGGAVGTGYTLMVNGLIDDVRIYKRALKARDVASLYAEADALRLSLLGTGNNRTLSWPAWLGTPVLQSTPGLLPGGSVWTDVGGSPTLDGYYYKQNVTIQAGNLFYRLRPGQ